MADERWKECKHHHDGCACREHAWEEQVARLKFELDVEKSNYECLKGEWNRAVALAQEHCPKPGLGQAWLTDGIPLLAERAKRAEVEVERLKEELQAEKQSAMESIGAWQVTAGEWGAKCHHLKAEVERIKSNSTERDALLARVAELEEIGYQRSEYHPCAHGVTCNEVDRLTSRIAELDTEIARLKGETYCAYCGERFPLDAPDSCEQIGNHIQVCPKHPMRAVEQQLEEMRVAKGWMEQKAVMFRDQCDAERKRASELGAELERLRIEHSEWHTMITEQFMRMSRALETVRERLPSGEPARDDATEVEALVAEVARLKKEHGNGD
jgi:hypothetical protein